MKPPVTSRRFRAVSPTTLLVVGFVAGVIARVPGLTTGSGLFRDDAWVAAPAETSFGHAATLVSTFPGFSLGLWPWLHLMAPSVLAAQLPAFLAGLAVLPALWWVLRRFSVEPWIAAVVAVALSLSPVVITYSTRVKPYTAELVLAALVLGLSTTRSPRFGWWLLGLVTMLAFAVSFATAPVIGAAWLVIAMRERKSPAFVRSVLRPAAAVGLWSLFILWLTWHPVPPSLKAFWQPFFIDWSTPSSIARSAQHLLGGLSSSMTGAPLLTTSRPLTTLVALSVLVSLSALCVIGVWVKRLEVLAPTLVMVFAVILSGLHLVPLGSGRTDEVLYPALAILLAFGLSTLCDLKHVHLQRVVSVGVCLATLMVLVTSVTVHRAQYPLSDLNGALIQAEFMPGQDRSVAVIDAPLRYNFAWSGFAATKPPARVDLVVTSTNEAGYTVELAHGQPQLFVAGADHGDSTYHPFRWVREVSKRVPPGESITFFSITEQVVNPTTGHLPGQALDPHRSPFWKAFIHAGWKPGRFGVVRGVYFQTLIPPSVQR